MSLAAGKLNKRIRIEKRSGNSDDINQPLDSWVTNFDTWASMLGATGMGTIATSAASGGVSKQVANYSFRIRFRGMHSVTNAMRIKYAGEIFDIMQVNHDLADRQWTDIICSQGASDG
jgi:SPP1 family predicted phage head-tail adaptor